MLSVREGDPTIRDLIRGAVRLHVLHHAAEEAVHGAWLSEELLRHGYDISPGKLYPTLHRMEQEGLIASERVTAGGRARRTYRITPVGTRILEEGRRALRELAAEILDTNPDPNG